MAVTSEKTDDKTPAAANPPEGVTTRDDAKDLGVPMIEGDAATEPVGPEDALGSGQKRGDYSGRQPENTDHYAAVVNPGYDRDDPNSPRSVLVHQNPLVEQLGDDKGVKGGTRPLTDEVASVPTGERKPVDKQ